MTGSPWAMCAPMWSTSASERKTAFGISVAARSAWKSVISGPHEDQASDPPLAKVLRDDAAWTNALAEGPRRASGSLSR
jgi:hypothetical protein